MKPCRHCGKDYEPLSYQLAKRYYECPPCGREYRRQVRARRKAQGKSYPRTIPTLEAVRAYEVRRKQLPGYHARATARSSLRRQKPYVLYQEAARLQVARAIRRGELTRQPCEVCGASRTHGHHDDYDKPLDVRWLCPLHHSEHHARERRARTTGGAA